MRNNVLKDLVLFTIVMFFACCPGKAWSQDCNQVCFEEALECCNISEPAEDQECFEDEFYWCREYCCYDFCEMADDCHMTCEEQYYTCEEVCSEDCMNDESCIEECMNSCWQDSDDCHMQCEEDIALCYDNCMNDSAQDIDGDGLPDEEDNCPYNANELQEDTDQDGVGDACDNCSDLPNPDQSDLDEDCSGNVCDLCPSVFSNQPYQDTDQDGTGDACDEDIDSDGILNALDNCPYVVNPGQEDIDQDGVGDACDHAEIHVSNFTSLDINISRHLIEDPGGSIIEQDILGDESTNYILNFDISNHDRIVGWYYPADCTDDSHHGFILGDNRDNNPDTDDAVKIDFPGSDDTIVWGIYDVDSAGGWNRFVGRYVLDGTHGFWAERGYAAESGLWYYNFHSLHYPGSSFTDAWDYAFVDGHPSIVGRCITPGYIYQGYLYDQATSSYTLIHYTGAMSTYPCGLNNAGYIVGYYYDYSYVSHGFIYDGTTYSSLDVPGAYSTKAYRINNMSKIAGYYEDINNNNMHGFIYDGVSFTTFDLPGKKDTMVFGLNDNDRVVGYYRDETGLQPFVADPMLSVPSLNSADYDGDSDVDGSDLEQFVGFYHTSSLSADVDNDNDVDLDDLSTFAQAFGTTGP